MGKFESIPGPSSEPVKRENEDEEGKREGRIYIYLNDFNISDLDLYSKFTYYFHNLLYVLELHVKFLFFLNYILNVHDDKLILDSRYWVSPPT